MDIFNLVAGFCSILSFLIEAVDFIAKRKKIADKGKRR